MTSRPELEGAAKPTGAPRVRGAVRVIAGIHVGLGLVRTVKGLVSLLAGRDASYWGDDFAYGALFIAFGVYLYVRFRRPSDAPASKRSTGRG